jgi:molybdenum transport protein
MLRISDARLDYFMAEDVPYVDLTSEILGIGDAPGTMEYFSRESCVVAGVNEVARLAKSAGCTVEILHSSGSHVVPDEPILRVHGRAGDLHQVWKVGLNLLDHLSAVATRTRAMVDAVHEVNPNCEVLTTRKSMPGCKDLLVEAVMVGGAFPHRLGLSETVLVFDHHMKFLGGFDEFVKRIPEFRSRCIEKKLFVEASAKQAPILAAAGVDGIQFDKVPADELTELVTELRSVNPHATLIAAGGINPQNAATYAATGVDGLATTAPFSAKPLDMSVRMTAL